MTLNATNYSISKSLFEKIANAFKKAVRFIHRRGGYKAEYLKEDKVKPLIEHTYEAFSEAVDFGVKDNVIPEAMKMYLKNNTFVFSGFKTHQQLERVSRLLHDDDGHVKPFNRFFKDVQSIDKKYNRTYLQAEYNFAVASAQSAGQWHEFSQYADRYYLQYRTAKDERVREEHAILDGITLPFDDKFWDEFFPPNGWNCFVAGTPILTAKGWKPIESIKRGDLIVGGSGQYRIVIGTHAKTVNDELITIRSKRSSTTCTKNHRFLSHRGWIEAERLSPNDILIQVGKISFKQKLINAIHNTPILCRQIFMSFITKRKSSSSFAIYNHIQRWYKKIRNIELAQKICLKLKSFFFKIFRNNTFCRRKRLSQCTHSFRMLFASFHGCFTGFFSDVFAKERRGRFKFFSDIPNHLAVFFRFALSHMPTFLSKLVIGLSKQFTRFFSSFRIVFPLRFDSFSSVANSNIIFLKKFRNSSVVDFPKQTDVSVASSLNNIPQYQGIRDIDSFNGFNSFYDFLRHTFFHCRYDLILCKDTKKNTPTMVFNLSIYKDESYIIPTGIVHNCRCEAIQVSKKRYEPSNPSEALARGRAATYKPNADGINKAAIFRFNPGKEHIIFMNKHPYFKTNDAKKIRSILNPNNEYTRIWKSDKNNGAVYKTTKQNKAEKDKNIDLAKIIAEKTNSEIMMLGIIDEIGVKNPDTFNISRNIYQEYKIVTSDKPDRLGKNIQEAKDQSPYVVIRNTGKISLDDAITQAKSRIKRHLKIKEVIIVHNDDVYIFNRGDI